MDSLLLPILMEIRQAQRHQLHYVALVSAMTLPDMCGKAENPQAGPRERWVSWFNENMDDRYVSEFKMDPRSGRPHLPPIFDGETAYAFRCSLLHEGSALSSLPGGQQQRVVFLADAAGLRLVGASEADGEVLISLPSFLDDLLSAVANWYYRHQGGPVTRNLETLVRLYPDGAFGVSGFPVIG